MLSIVFVLFWCMCGVCLLIDPSSVHQRAITFMIVCLVHTTSWVWPHSPRKSSSCSAAQCVHCSVGLSPPYSMHFNSLWIKASAKWVNVVSNRKGNTKTTLYFFLQRETLLRQLETNQLDIDATLEELNVQQETEDQNYDMYVTMSILLHVPVRCTSLTVFVFQGD